MIVGTFNGASVVQAPTSGYRDLQLYMNDAVSASTATWTQQTFVYPWLTQWWTAAITLPPMNRSDAAPWIAFLGELQGKTNVFLIGNPEEAVPMGSIPLNTSLTLSGANAGSTINVAGLPASENNLLLPGDNLQIGYRLYRVLEPVNSNASGDAAVSIFPYLRDNPASGTAVSFQNCQGLFRLTSNKRGFSYSPTGGWGFDPLDCMEAL